MSYASTMEFLRTGISPGGGTEDPRYAGFGQSIAGRRLQIKPRPQEAPWDCAENCAKKYPGDYQFPEYQKCYDACLGEWGWAAKPQKKSARPPSPAESAVVRPLWAASQMARFSSVAGKSRADAVRLGFAGGCCGR